MGNIETCKELDNYSFLSVNVVELTELKNLFFALSNKACNLKCKHCYIERSLYKKEEDFIPLEKVKQALLDLGGTKLNSIYLTGGEPLFHPDFNAILRMCLKVAPTTVLSNGVLINDKKARFLRKIEDENENEAVFRISIDHFDELKNDEIRGRGSFRKALGAVINLAKYEFNPIISVCNYYNEPKDVLFEGFYNLLKKYDFEFEEINLKVMPYFEKAQNKIENIENIEFDKSLFDCATSRIVGANGVYSCPVLIGDFRARMGSDLKNYSKKMYLDTEKCVTCINTNCKNQINDYC